MNSEVTMLKNNGHADAKQSQVEAVIIIILEISFDKNPNYAVFS